jgi:dihydroorotase
MTEKRSASISVNQRPNSLLLRGGRVIDPAQKLDAEADVLLRDGRVAEIGTPALANSAPGRGNQNTGDVEVIDVRGLIVAPGFIDLHVHLREPGQWQKETIATGTAAAAAGGFTSVCAMPNTSPINDLPAITRWVQEAERGAVVNVFPVAAATVGSKGEQLTDYYALAKAGAVAVSDDGLPLGSDRIMREALRAAAGAGLPVLQHAEDKQLTEGSAMHDGPTAFRLGLRGMPTHAESGVVERDIDLARETGGHLHVQHISTAAALEALRHGRRMGARVTCEVTPHHFTLIDEDVIPYDTRFKMNPPLRSREDRDALLRGLEDGTVDAIATDHAPHAPHEKAVEFDRAPFGIIGLETALALAITQLHMACSLPLVRLVELFSTNPARIIGKADRGTLAVGSPADVVVFDPKKRWRYDTVKGASKAHNSPFDGRTLTGKAIMTIVGGKIAYREG